MIKYLLSHESSKQLIPFDSLEKSLSCAASQPFVSCVEKDRRIDKRPDVYVSLMALVEMNLFELCCVFQDIFPNFCVA